MSLGETLRQARKKKRMSQSEVAAATRMKIQLVEDLEDENFSRIAAPVYGKGFIKLYAEFVGLDPKPLIDEYVVRFVSPDAGRLRRDMLPSPEPEPPAAAAVTDDDRGDAATLSDVASDEPDLFSQAAGKPAEKGRRRLLEGGVIRRDRSSGLGVRPPLGAAVTRWFQGVRVFVTDLAARLRRHSASAAMRDEDAPGGSELVDAVAVSSARYVLMSIAALIVVLVVATILRRSLRHGDADDVTNDDGRPAGVLRVAAAPPEPYLD